MRLQRTSHGLENFVNSKGNFRHVLAAYCRAQPINLYMKGFCNPSDPDLEVRDQTANEWRWHWTQACWSWKAYGIACFFIKLIAAFVAGKEPRCFHWWNKLNRLQCGVLRLHHCSFGSSTLIVSISGASKQHTTVLGTFYE